MTDKLDVSRRGLVGVGAALAAGGAAALTAGAAHAAGPSALDGPPQSQASPIASTIASVRRNFIVYRTLGEFDFSVESSAAERQFGGKGVHSTGAQTSIWGTFDVPGGVRLYDIEFYVFNNTGSTAFGGVWLWSASDGYLGSQLATVSIPSTNSLTATSATFTSANNGPYPTGTKIFVTVFTPTNGNLQINGARLGMNGGGAVSLLPAPVRAYDSRTAAKFAAGETRTVSIPSSLAPTGTVGLMTQVTVLEGVSAGYVQIYPANLPAPDAGRLHHQNAASIIFTPTMALPTTRQLQIYSRRAAHVIVDVVGTIS